MRYGAPHTRHTDGQTHRRTGRRKDGQRDTHRHTGGQPEDRRARPDVIYSLSSPLSSVGRRSDLGTGTVLSGGRSGLRALVGQLPGRPPVLSSTRSTEQAKRGPRSDQNCLAMLDGVFVSGV